MTKTPKTVFIFNNTHSELVHGGAEQTVQEIITTIIDKGFKVEHFFLTSKKKCKFDDLKNLTLNPVKRPFFNLPWEGKKIKFPGRSFAWHLRSFFSFSVCVAIYRATRKATPDLIVTHNLNGIGFAPWLFAKVKGVPIIHFIHDYNLLCFKSSRFKKRISCQSTCFQCLPRQYIAKAFAPKFSHVLGVSNRAIEVHHENKFFVNYVKHVIRVTPTIQPSINQHPGTPQFDFGFIGSTQFYKGIDLFIDAAKNTEFSFAIAGKVDDQLKDKYAQVPNLYFLGLQKKEDFYPLVKCVIVPSRWEDPAPRVIYESMKYKKPILVSNKPSLIETAISHNVQYETFEDGNVEDLIRKLPIMLQFESSFGSLNQENRGHGEQVFEVISKTLMLE